MTASNINLDPTWEHKGLRYLFGYLYGPAVNTSAWERTLDRENLATMRVEIERCVGTDGFTSGAIYAYDPSIGKEPVLYQTYNEDLTWSEHGTR